MLALALTTVIITALFIHARFRFHQYARHERVAQAALQEELNALQQRMNLSARDPVTNLLGWQLFEDRVNQGIKECARYKFIMGVLYVDIDHFKLINSAMGQESANILLLETAERLESCIRQVDSIARQGKDTFVIMLAQLAKQETAAIIIQRMLQALAQPFMINGNSISMTVCIGAAFYPADGLTAGALMQNAEYAMLQAKSRGNQHYQFYQENLHADSQRELSVYNSLSSDLFLDELKVIYQPVMNVEQQSMFCVDTHIVWQHPALGAISAEELFAHADKQNKLNKITERVFDAACREFQRWRQIGLKVQVLAIPVWLKQLESTPFVYRLSQIMQQNKIEPSSVMLEIHESNTPISLDILEKSFNMLQYLGVKIAVDHFGSGSFSLRYLKLFSVHYLRLDSAMVNDIVESEETRVIIRAIALFASTLSLQVIASGVESEEQVKVLQELGVTLMQGKLLSEPLSETEMADKMTNV